MSRTRIGVIGAGVIARRHVRTLARFDDVQIAAISDVRVDRAVDLAAGVGATPYDSAPRMLDTQRLDAVWLCAPPFAHGDLDLEVVERGLPLFVEKSLAADLATAERIAVQVEGRGLPTAVGHHWRWLDTLERAQELLAKRPARLATGYWLDATPPIGWWQRRELSGGQFVEQTAHVVDLARVLVGEVVEVSGYASRTPRTTDPDSDVDDVTAACVWFATGAVGSFTSTCLLPGPYRVGLHLFGEGIAVEVTEKQLRIDTGDGPTVVDASGDPFEREDRAFVDAVQGRPDRTRTTYAEALRTHWVTTAAARSAAASITGAAGDGAALMTPMAHGRLP
jgi:predicted dehydrogenase